MKTAVLLSGGLDSTTCLALAVHHRGSNDVIALNMYYGQKHKKEIECAREIAKHYGVEYIELAVDSVMQFSNCALLEHSTDEIKQGTYAEQKKDGFVNTYVPFRNGLFLSIASAVALSKGCGEVMYGAHKDDVAENAYPDCSIAFVKAMSEAIEVGTGGEVLLAAPFITKNKAEIVRVGLSLNVPYEKTWSCYEGGEKPCGKCATCLDRIKAFQENGVNDPVF